MNNQFQETSGLYDLSSALWVVGVVSATLGIVGVLLSLAVFSAHNDFSFFTTYLSDIGNTPKWPMVVFNTAMIMVAPVRYAFLVLLVSAFARRGAGRAMRVAILLVGVPVVLGSIGMSAFPASFDLALHEMSAGLYFFGVVILQCLIGLQEARLRLSRILVASSFAVVVIYLIFAVLLMLVGTVEGVSRNVPVIWEWLSFAALMVWLIAHTVILGRSPRRD